MQAYSLFLEEHQEDISEDEIKKHVDDLSWVDIFDLYNHDEIVIDPPDESVEDEFVEESLNQSQRMRRALIMKRNAYRIALARRTKLLRMSDQNTLAKRSMLAAKRSMWKRFLGGRSKDSLSAQEKAMIEDRIASRKKLISTIATRLMPKMRTIESSRLTHRFS